jgi:hypothetical protein
VVGLPFLVLPSVCILARQFAYMMVARDFKIKTADVILGPFGEVAQLERIPKKAN